MSSAPKEEVTYYFPHEGRDFMEPCIDQTLAYCSKNTIAKVVMFTATGDGPLYASEKMLSQEFADIKIIAITPPAGKPYKIDPQDPTKGVARAGILNPARKMVLTSSGINVHSAHLPFKGIQSPEGHISEWAKVGEALGILGGGFALCIQAILIACDAGEVDVGERVVALTADTSIVALATRTDSFISPREGFLLEHVICRPCKYNISKREHRFAKHLWEKDDKEGVPQ